MKYILEDRELKSNWERCACGNLAEMQEICQGTFLDDNDGNDIYYAIYVYKVLRCPSCHSVNVIQYTAYGNADDDEIPQIDSEIVGPQTREYTRKVLYTSYKKELEAVPGPIVDVFNQARAVIPSSPRAAFILCGATLEEICRAHNIPTVITKENGKEERLDLYKRLEKLFQNRNLPDDDNLRPIFHCIRKLRNIGAHSSQEIFEEVSEIDADMLLSLLGYVLERLYVNDARAKKAQETLGELADKLDKLKETRSL